MKSGMKSGSIWYSRNFFFRDAIMGYEWLKSKGLDKINLGNLNVTHAMVAEVLTDDAIKGALWAKFQADNGFRLPESIPVGREPNEVGHTSMSVGDIIEVDGKLTICDSIGWHDLPDVSADTDPV